MMKITKIIKWKFLLVSCLITLLPVLLGVALWNSLPENIAIHFDMYNRPDNFAPKWFAVFGLPVMMVILQTISCAITDFKSAKHGERKKFENVVKWIIPVLCIVLQVITLGYSLGWAIDIRVSVMLIVSAIFLVMGNYQPKLDYVKHYDCDTQAARKINRFIGRLMVIMGILGIVSIFLPPVASIVWLILLIPFAITSVVYGIVVGTRKHEK